MRKILISAISSRVYVAAIQDQQVVFLEAENAARTTSSFMARHTARALHVMGGVDALGVLVGPGSWTGARITIATAKGLALATQCPVTMIPTHDLVWAARGPGSSGRVVIWAAEREPWHATYQNGARIAAVEPIEIGSWTLQQVTEGKFDRKTHLLFDVGRDAPLLEEPFQADLMLRAFDIATTADGAVGADGLKTPFMPSYPPKQ